MKPPIYPQRVWIKVLQRRGFALNRWNGSHAILRSDDGREVTVCKTMDRRSTIYNALKSAGLTVTEFEALKRQ